MNGAGASGPRKRTGARAQIGAGDGSALPGRPLDPPEVRRRHEGISHAAGCLDGTGLALEEPSCSARRQAMGSSGVAAGQLRLVRAPVTRAGMVAGCRADLGRLSLRCAEIGLCELRVSDPLGFGRGSPSGRVREGSWPDHQHERRGGQQENSDGVRRAQERADPCRGLPGFHAAHPLTSR